MEEVARVFDGEDAVEEVRRRAAEQDAETVAPGGDEKGEERRVERVETVKS